MMRAETLNLEGRPDRTLFLYDTFEGMTEPTSADVDLRGVVAQELRAQEPRGRESYDWAYAPKGEVERNLRSMTYPPAPVSSRSGEGRRYDSGYGSRQDCLIAT